MTQSQISPNKFALNGSQLKMLAVVTMLIDHIGAYLLDYDSALYPLFRSVGRLAFPIFCLMIAEGAQHTRSFAKYAGRLAIFALISNPPYNLVHGEEWYSLEKLNVFFTLLLGLLAVGSIQKLAPCIFRKLGKFSLADNPSACTLLGIPFCLALYLAAYTLNTDYGGYGVAAIVIFYILRNHKAAAWGCFTLLTFICYDLALIYYPPEMNMSYVMVEMNLHDILTHQIWNGRYTLMFVNARQMFASLAVIPACFYNGEKGRSSSKYFFYAFYPMHLMLIWIIQLLIK